MNQLSARAHGRSTTRLGGCAALLTALALAGCSSSGGSSSPSGSATTSSPAASSSAVGTPDAATTAEITKAYTTFFDSKTGAATSQSFLQHGSVFTTALATQAKSPAAQGLSATVSKVVLQSPNLGVVTFTLLSAGKAVLTDTPGYIVKEGGAWKVAAGTFCALVKLQGQAPKACDDPSITALPS